MAPKTFLRISPTPISAGQADPVGGPRNDHEAVVRKLDGFAVSELAVKVGYLFELPRVCVG
jgi:hypothetical protein